MTTLLDELLERIQPLPAEDKAKLAQDIDKALPKQRWYPNPGPQMDAYLCEADELFYGGQAGGGKSDLILGLSITSHSRSLVLRRTNKEASKFVERYEEILGSRDGFNGQENVWRLDGKIIDISGCQYEDDKQRYKGIPHDLKAFDEISDFTESQYLFITIWNRSANPDQRCRIVCTGNPPTRPEGLWVIKRWAAWLDPKYPNPAKPGELRWFLTIDGRDTEVDGPGPHFIDGEYRRARSRTFIPAKLSDNPDLSSTNYASILDSLPDELRAAYRDGRFDANIKDDPWQVIPTEWVRLAQARWRSVPPAGVPMCAIGVDVAQGGDDKTVLAPRHDGWFATLIEKPGKLTPGGADVAGLVIANRRDEAHIVIDVGGGWGGEAYGHLRANIKPELCTAYMGVKQSMARSSDNQFKFLNVRSAVYWRFREALDPTQPGGSPIMLPDDNELVADLCAPTYEVKPGGVLAITPKEKLVELIGRSPDKGDAVVMSWSAGPRLAEMPDGKWHRAPSTSRNHSGSVKVVMGHAAQRRR